MPPPHTFEAQQESFASVFSNNCCKRLVGLASQFKNPSEKKLTPLAISQVSGDSQSFNTMNSLRILGRWIRMFAIANQSSVPMAYTQFTDVDAAECGSRMMPSDNRDRLVDCMEEFVKYTIVMRPHFDLFGYRFGERIERAVAKEKRPTWRRRR